MLSVIPLRVYAVITGLLVVIPAAFVWAAEVLDGPAVAGSARHAEPKPLARTERRPPRLPDDGVEVDSFASSSTPVPAAAEPLAAPAPTALRQPAIPLAAPGSTLPPGPPRDALEEGGPPAASATQHVLGTSSAQPLPLPEAAPPAPARLACGTTTCAPGEVCCSPACDRCSASLEQCARQTCGTTSFPGATRCGKNTCNVGEYCCNRGCGLCAVNGSTCSDAGCDDEAPTYPISQICGMNTCSVGLVCCDATCGLCAPLEQCGIVHC